MRGAIVIGGYVNGLGLVRALGSRGIPVAVVTTKPYDIAHRSRWVAERAHVEGIEERPDRLVATLLDRAGDWSGAALLPTNDEALLALAEHRDRLAAAYRVVAPPWEVALTLVDKERMREAALGAGLDLPIAYGPAVPATAALPGIRFPVIVKPTLGYRFVAHFGRKLFAARDRDELGAAIVRLVDAGLSGAVHDLVPGADSRIYAHGLYVDARGEPSAGITVRKLRQGPPRFGVARVAEVVPDPPGLREATVELVRRIGHRGIAVAEFKHDPRDGSFRFLEVNGRSVVYNELLRRAGLDLAALAWADVVCGAPERVVPRAWPGAWIHLHADLLYSAFHRRADAVPWREFVAPYRRPRIYAVWSAADPAPFAAQWMRTAGEGVSVLLGRPGRPGRDRVVERVRALVAPVSQAGAEPGGRETTARNLPP